MIKHDEGYNINLQKYTHIWYEILQAKVICLVVYIVQTVILATPE